MNLSAQRAAIEELLPGLRPCVVGSGRRYFLGCQEVFFLGFSAGGAGGRGQIRVAVFGPEAAETSSTLPREPQLCAGAVLLRSVGRGAEMIEAAMIFGRIGAALETVEALESASVEPHICVFRRTGAKALYPVLITAYLTGSAKAG